MFKNGTLHRFLLTLLGLAHLLCGGALAVLGALNGANASIVAAGVAVTAPAILMLHGRLRPALLSRPGSRLAAAACLVSVAGLSLVGAFPGILLAGPVAQPLAPLALLPVLVLAGMMLTGLLPAATVLSIRASRAAAEDAPPPGRHVPLPSIGAAMKLYVVADWVVLRALGAGLLGVAWMLWTAQEAGRAGDVTALSRGLEPAIAIYAYAVLGALLLLPVALPMGLASPRHVFGGLLKAVMLVGAAWALMDPLDVAIDAYATEPYRPTLHAAVPKLFKAIAGIAVTSALLIAFFRQLSRPVRIDHTGAAIHVLSPAEMAAMRRERMGRTAPGH